MREMYLEHCFPQQAETELRKANLQKHPLLNSEIEIYLSHSEPNFK